jgi:hypothetical protein
MNLEFNLGNHGWLDIDISHEGKELNIPVSYLSDSIEELISSLCIFLERDSEVIIRFQTEPGEYRFRLKPCGNDCLFEIYDFDDNFCKDELEKGQCIISSVIDSGKLINKFYREIVKLKEIGVVEFKKRWGYDFPQGNFERFLKAKEYKKNNNNI